MGVIKASADAYTELQYQLQPTGPAWPKEGDSTSARVYPPTAGAMSLLHARLNGLIDEADGRTTSELLIDWERVVGLPDPCLDPPASTEERRRRVVQRLTYQGGQSVAFFIALLDALGFPGCTVKEYRPMKCNSKCNAAINQGGWRYGWRVSVPEAANKKILTVTGRCNDPLASWGNPGLECLLAIHKPAHTRLFVGYGAQRLGGGLFVVVGVAGRFDGPGQGPFVPQVDSDPETHGCVADGVADRFFDGVASGLAVGVAVTESGDVADGEPDPHAAVAVGGGVAFAVERDGFP